MSYATVADLESYLNTDAPDDAERLLERASELIDYATFNRLVTGSDLTSTQALDTAILAARAAEAKTACCQQVEFWIQNGEGTDIEPAIKSKSVGRTSVTYANSSAGGDDGLAPRAKRTLMLAGLLSRGASLQ